MVKDGILISTGYNGMPWGCSDDILPWDGTAKNEEENKRPYGNKATPTRGPHQVLEKYFKISVRGPGRGWGLGLQFGDFVLKITWTT